MVHTHPTKRTSDDNDGEPWFWESKWTSAHPANRTLGGEFSAYYSLPHQHLTAWTQPSAKSAVALRNSTTLKGISRWK
jgi:hypothetical protein